MAQITAHQLTKPLKPVLTWTDQNWFQRLS